MKRILLVEDNPLDAKIAKTVLEKEDYEVYHASEVFKAFEILDVYPIDIVLLDWQLPRITGIDFLKTIKKNEKFVNLPVVIISGKNELKEIQTAIKSGANDYIIKPMDPLIVSQKLSRFFTKEIDWQLMPLPDSENNEAALLIPAKILSLSEVGLQLQTTFPLAVGENFEINLSILKGLDIANAEVRVYDRIEQKDQFISKCILIGLRETDLQKIRLYVKKVYIEKKIA